MEVYIDSMEGGAASKLAEHPDECGTACCIAGWAAILNAPPDAVVSPGGLYLKYADERSVVIEDAAATALGIGWNSEEWYRLVYVEQWPDEHYDKWSEGEGDSYSQALAAAARIDHFIATGGAE